LSASIGQDIIEPWRMDPPFCGESDDKGSAGGQASDAAAERAVLPDVPISACGCQFPA